MRIKPQVVKSSSFPWNQNAGESRNRKFQLRRLLSSSSAIMDNSTFSKILFYFGVFSWMDLLFLSSSTLLTSDPISRDHFLLCCLQFFFLFPALNCWKIAACHPFSRSALRFLLISLYNVGSTCIGNISCKFIMSQSSNSWRLHDGTWRWWYPRS